MIKMVTRQDSRYARSLIEASLDPLITICPKGKITDMNQATVNITGIEREKLIGTDFFNYFTESQQAHKVYKKVLAKGSVADLPLTLRHKNGNLTNVLFNGSVYKDDEGNVPGMVIVVRNVTVPKADELINANKKLAIQNEEKEKRAAELIIANKELEFQKEEKGKRADELIIADKELEFQKEEKGKRADELIIADKELEFQTGEKEKRAEELLIANKELVFQNKEKEKRAAELIIANRELVFQNDEKEKRANELIIANKELEFQNDEKEKRAAELAIANKELVFQNDEKEKRAAELAVANTELAFQNGEKEKRAAELVVANKELVFQNDEKEKRAVEKEKRAAEFVFANKELEFQNDEKEKRAAELAVANKELAFQNDEKEKRAAELVIANKELAFQNDEKEKRAAELVIANKELAFQNQVKEKRANELIIANKELAFQNEEKEKRAAELVIADKELDFQTQEKEKRAAELAIAGIELDFQNKEKEKREIANKELEAFSYSLKLASQYSLSLIEASRDPLVTINTEGKITDMNNATVNIIGMSREKLTGTDFFNYFTEPQKAREVYQEVFAKGSVADSPLTLCHKDGKLTDVLFNGSVYKDDMGNVLGVVIVARDITNQKLFENELIEAKSNAERATQKAEESTKLKEAFLANMSHEIRTPMNAIIGFTDLLLKKNLGEQENDFVRTIKMSGETLLGIINDVLDVSKIESGSMAFEESPLNIKYLFTSFNMMFSQKAKQKNLNLSFECDNNVPDMLLGDPARLSQILINLVGNALKFTPKGNIIVLAKTLSEENDIVQIEISVADTGIGISEVQQQHIFERFRQAESHTTRHYGGTGLGLSIARQLVELQGGLLTVKSKEGKGSVFSFVLPFKKSKENQMIFGKVNVDINTDELSELNVLIVEDNPINIKFVMILFSEYGIKTDIAENGKLAIEKIKNNQYDLVLMDIEMPEMNGYEAATAIRKDLKNNIPIIAMTAHAMAGEREKCLKLGMNDYVSKPIDTDLLFKKMLFVTSCSKKTLTMESKEKVIDLCYLFKSVSGKKEPMLELIQIFLDQIPADIALINEAVIKADYLKIKQISHRMKSTVSVMGISKLNPVLQQMEDLGAAATDINKIKKLSHQLIEICNKAIAEAEIEKNILS